MAALFVSLPFASRLFLGAWDFAGAAPIGLLCFLTGTYIHIVSRRRFLTLRDPAARLGKALQLASSGKIDRAIRLLTTTIQDSPRLWQAFQYRGEMYLTRPGFVQAALDDFDQAIRLAPEEPHLHTLRAQAQHLLDSPRV